MTDRFQVVRDGNRTTITLDGEPFATVRFHRDVLWCRDMSGKLITILGDWDTLLGTLNDQLRQREAPPTPFA